VTSLQRIWSRWSSTRERWDPRAFRGLFRVRGAASFFSNDVVDQVLDGSGSFAFPAPRSSLPVARSNLRGFPSSHRPLLTSLRLFAGARPSWASLLSRTRGHRCRPRSIGPGRFVFPTAFLEIRLAFRQIPFHRLHPRRSPSQGVATPSDPSSKLESRSDLVVSHDLVGFLRRLLGFSPGCSSPFRVTKDLRICCAPLPIVGFDAFLPPHPVVSAPQAHSCSAICMAKPEGLLLFTRIRGSPHRSSYPPEDSPHLQPFHVSVVVASADFAFPSIRDRLDESVSSFIVLVVSKGRCPSRLCSAGGSVPSSAV